MNGGWQMRIVFCDDDTKILNQLQQYVQEYFQRKGLEQPEYAAYQSGDELLQKEQKADIVFLDVEMPGRSGIHVGAQLMKKYPRTKVFIVTSYPDYLDEAMHFRVFRFLSKPIDKNRLFYNLKDALYQYTTETTIVAIETQDQVLTCMADEIMCLESIQRKTKVYTINGNYISVKGIEYWEHLLKLPYFYQSHRSFIINLKYVTSFDKLNIQLRYHDVEIPCYLAKRKYVDFKNKYLLYLESVR